MGEAKRRKALDPFFGEVGAKRIRLELFRLAESISEPGFACISLEQKSTQVRWIPLSVAPSDIQQALANINFKEARAVGTEDDKEFNVSAVRLDWLLTEVERLEAELEQLTVEVE